MEVRVFVTKREGMKPWFDGTVPLIVESWISQGFQQLMVMRRENVVLLLIFFFCLFSCKLCALLVLLFDNTCSIVGFSLGECLVVMLVLRFVWGHGCFKLFKNQFVQMGKTCLYCFYGSFFHVYLGVSCKCNCHKWPMDLHERKSN